MALLCLIMIFQDLRNKPFHNKQTKMLSHTEIDQSLAKLGKQDLSVFDRKDPKHVLRKKDISTIPNPLFGCFEFDLLCDQTHLFQDMPFSQGADAWS